MVLKNSIAECDTWFKLLLRANSHLYTLWTFHIFLCAPSCLRLIYFPTAHPPSFSITALNLFTVIQPHFILPSPSPVLTVLPLATINVPPPSTSLRRQHSPPRLAEPCHGGCTLTSNPHTLSSPANKCCTRLAAHTPENAFPCPVANDYLHDNPAIISVAPSSAAPGYCWY